MLRTMFNKVFNSCPHKFKPCNSLIKWFEKPEIIANNCKKEKELQKAVGKGKDEQRTKKISWINWSNTKVVLESPIRTWNALVRSPRHITEKDFERYFRFPYTMVDRGKPRQMTGREMDLCDFNLPDTKENDQIKMETYLRIEPATEKVLEYISSKLLIALRNTKYTINIQDWPRMSVTTKLKSIGIDVNPLEIWYPENFDHIKKILNETTGLDFDVLAKKHTDLSEQLTDSVTLRIRERGETTEIKHKDKFESESDTLTHMIAIVLGENTEFIVYEGLSWNAKHARMLTNKEGLHGLTKTMLIYVNGTQVAKLREEHLYGHDNRLKELEASRTRKTLTINSLNYKFKCTSISINYKALIKATNKLFVESSITMRYKNFLKVFVRDLFFDKSGELSSFKEVKFRLKGTVLYKQYRIFFKAVVTDVFYIGTKNLSIMFYLKKVMKKINMSQFYCFIILAAMMLFVFSMSKSTPADDDIIELFVILSY